MRLLAFGDRSRFCIEIGPLDPDRPTTGLGERREENYRVSGLSGASAARRLSLSIAEGDPHDRLDLSSTRA